MKNSTLTREVPAPGRPRGGSAPAHGALAHLREFVRGDRTLQVTIYLGILAVWQVTAIVQGSFFLPRLEEIVLAFPELLAQGHHVTMLASLQQLAIGFALALLVAIPVGALIGVSRIFDDILSPYVNALYATSKESLLPFLIIIFGTELGYRVSVVVLFAVFFPVINTAAGVRYVEGSLTETAHAFCTSRWRMFSRIYLPAAAPFVVAGVRLGLGMAIKGMVVAELWVSMGTGRLLRQFGAIRALDLYFAIAVTVIVVALGSDRLLQMVERRLLRGASIEDRI